MRFGSLPVGVYAIRNRVEGDLDYFLNTSVECIVELRARRVCLLVQTRSMLC